MNCVRTTRKLHHHNTSSLQKQRKEDRFRFLSTTAQTQNSNFVAQELILQLFKQRHELHCVQEVKGDAENARNENTRHENAAPKIRGENGKSET